MFDGRDNLAIADTVLARFDLHVCLNAFDYKVVSAEQVAEEGSSKERIAKAQPWTMSNLQEAVQVEWIKGALSKNIMYRVVEWKAGRQRKNFFMSNNASDVKARTTLFIRAVDSILASDLDWKSIGDVIHRFAGCPNAQRRSCQFLGQHPWKLSYVGIPITTALLRFYRPDIFGVLDRNALKALRKTGIICSGFGPEATQYPPDKVPSYFQLLRHIGTIVSPPMLPCQVDNALYVAGGGRQVRCPDPCSQHGAGFCSR